MNYAEKTPKMKINEKKEKNLIVPYLLGQLEGKELQQFTLRLMRDAQLQTEVEAHRVLLKTLWKNDPNRASAKPTKRWKWLPFLLGLGGLLVIGVVIFTIRATETTSATLPSNKNDQISVPLKQKNTEQFEKVKDSISPTDIPTIENKPTDTKEVKKEVPLQIEKSRPIAGNFDTNPLLENYFTPVRGANFKVSFPARVARFSSQNGQLFFQLKGSLETDVKQLEEVISLYIFSNKEEDYQEFRPIIKEKLVFEKQSNEKEFSFEWEKSLILNPGLYYYQIEGEDSGLLYVGKFELR